jgi:carbonic anhydrase
MKTMEKLIAGVRAFHAGPFSDNREFFERSAARAQQPSALFITCSDSRINPNLITQTEPGDLFLMRNVGNLIPPHGAGGGEAAAIEYSLEVLGIRNIIVCGHSQCGAIQAILERQRLAHLPAVQEWCDHAEATRRIVAKKWPGKYHSDLAAIAAKQNVLVQIEHLKTHPCVAARRATFDLEIYGWYYDIGAGAIEQYDDGTGEFQSLTEASNEAYA